METKYEFEVRAKHLQSTSVEVADSSSLKKLKNQLNESCLPDFVASQWQKSETSIAYLLYRWFLAIFSIACLGLNFYFDFKAGELENYLIFQTHLNLVFFMAVMVAGAFLVSNETIINSKLFTKVYGVLWHHTLTWSFFLTATYWLGLGNEATSALNTITNGIVAIVFFGELCIVRCYHRFRSFLFTLVYTFCYLTFIFDLDVFGRINKNGASKYLINWTSRSVTFWQILPLLIGLAIIHHSTQLIHFIRYQIKLIFVKRKSLKSDYPSLSQA